MANPGQPTLYKPEYCELAYNYCLLGATGEVLAEFFDVAPRTITNTVSYPPDTQACMFWLRNRQCQYRQARAEAAPDFVADDLAAALDAAGERLRHAAE